MISKRKRFVITSLALSLGFVGIQFLDENYRYLSILFLGILTAGLFTWSLWEGLKPNLTLLSLVLPVMFTIGVGLFWFLLPSSVYTRIPVVIIYGMGIYSLCLTSNIYTVSAIRNIALLRAARGVGFVLTLVTAFLLFDTILSLRSEVYINAILTIITSTLLFFQGIWSISLEEKFSKDFFALTFIPSLAITQVAALIYFWPVTVVVGSLFLTVAMYILLGLSQAKAEGRLFPATVREYLTVGALVFFGMTLITRWGA